MEVPSFLVTILEQELYDIQASLIHKIAKDHDMNAEEMISKYLKKVLCVVPNTEKRVDIIRRNSPRPVTADENRCIARVWNRGRGGQCSRQRQEEYGSYCTQHGREMKEKKSLRHGTIQENPPKEVFAPRSSKSVFYK